MGYTHYWYRKPGSTISDEQWARILKETGRVIVASKIPIAYECDLADTPPGLIGGDEGFIVFNGIGAHGHETFHFSRQPSGRVYDGEHFVFCKTARKPYDVLVTATLALIKDVIGDEVRVSSDGSQAEWNAALELASRVTGRSIAWPVTPQPVV